MSLDDRTECGVNAHTTGESKEFSTRKGVLCPPLRPMNNHTRKGALIERDQDKKPYQGIVVGADQGLDPGLVASADQGADQGLDPGLVASAIAGLPRRGSTRVVK